MAISLKGPTGKLKNLNGELVMAFFHSFVTNNIFILALFH